MVLAALLMACIPVFGQNGFVADSPQRINNSYRLPVPDANPSGVKFKLRDVWTRIFFEDGVRYEYAYKARTHDDGTRRCQVMFAISLILRF